MGCRSRMRALEGLLMQSEIAVGFNIRGLPAITTSNAPNAVESGVLAVGTQIKGVSTGEALGRVECGTSEDSQATLEIGSAA